MSDIKLFQVGKPGSQARELQSRFARLEKELQQLVESAPVRLYWLALQVLSIFMQPLSNNYL